MTSPPLTEKWVPLWPLTDSVLGELAYAQKATDTAIAVGTYATTTAIVTAAPITVDGNTPIIVEFFSCGVVPAPSGTLVIGLYDGPTEVGILDEAVFVGVGGSKGSLTAMRLTPSAGTHTYSVRAYSLTAVGTVRGGAGGNDQYSPTFIRITLAKPVVPADPPPGTWVPYTPILAGSITNPVLGSGGGFSQKGRYCQVGKLVICQGEVKFGTAGGSPGSGTYRISLPVPRKMGGIDYAIIGQCELWGSSAAMYAQGNCYVFDALGDLFEMTLPSAVPSGATAAVGAAVPWAWAAGHAIEWNITYEAS